jgi:hypothetical protein
LRPTALLVLAIPALVRADEGMWTFDHFPRAEVQKRYGFAVTDAWLEHVRLSSVRFINTGAGGGSGAFVSATGLVMTNHHIGADCINKLGRSDRNFLETGFYARTRADELRCPDLEVNVLVDIRDVTREVLSVARPGMDDAAVYAAAKDRMSALEKACVERTHGRCDVVSLYNGGLYDLYTYQRHTDVRLVFAPEASIAFFGGDPDNFEFPRYDLDVAFFRVYQDGAPLAPAHHLGWSRSGARDGELVFVPGHPGHSERLGTVARLEFLRDHGFPFIVRRQELARRVLETYGQQGPEPKRQAATKLYTAMNTLKLNAGRVEGLKDEQLMARKRADEAALREQLAGQPEYAGLFERLAAVTERRRALLERYYLVESSHLGSQLMGFADDLVRLVAERDKPNGQRLREYRDSALTSLELGLFTPAPIYPALDEALMAATLEWLQQALGAADPYVQTALAGRTPAARAHELIAGTQLADPALRRKLAADPRLVATSTDPLIVLARALDPQRRALRKLRDDTVEAPEKLNLELLARAIFAARGTSIAPDATFTLRLSYGQVAGYRQDGKEVPATTYIGGLYERSARFGGQPPYQLPPRWIQHRSQVDGTAPMNFASTNDIIGGNSGSPVINARAEVVGLTFDGNVQSLVGDFIYDPAVNRAVNVSSEGLIEVLRHVYDAGALADELRAPAAAPR